MEPLGKFAMICLPYYIGEYEEILKDDIEVKVWSENNLAKCATVAQGDETYL